MTEKIFTKQYHQAVLSALLQDKKFLRESAATLKPEYFEDIIHQKVAEIIFGQFSKSGEAPSKVGLLTELINSLSKHYRTKTPDQESSMAVKPAEAFVELIFVPIHGSIKDIKDSFLEFCRNQETKAALLEGYLGLEQGNIKWNEAAEIVRRTYMRSNPLGSEGVKVFGVDEQVRADFKEDDRKKFTTGFDSLDAAMYGGPRPGTVTVYISGAKGGKSMLLLQTTEANLRKGENVLYITLELSSEEVRRRLLCRLSHIKYREIPIRLDEALRAANAFQELHKCDIRIERFPAGVNCDDFRSFIYSLESSGFKPSVIIIDYGDLVGTCDKSRMDDEFSKQGKAYIEMRNLMIEFNAAGFTGSQANREAMEKPVVKMQDMADCIKKAQHADHLIGWCQTPLQKDQGEARLFYCGTRHGISGGFYDVRTDYERATIIEKPKHGRLIKTETTTAKPVDTSFKWDD